MQNHITRRRLIAGICAVLVILILGVSARFLYLHNQMQQNGNPSYSSQAVDWDGSFKTEGKEGYITMPGYDTVPLQEGKDTSKIVLANPDTNQCLFQFQLIRSDTGDVLYTSDMVKPGKAILSQKLSQSFTEGDYPLTIRINTFSEDGKTPYNGSDVETTLHVFKG